MKDKSWLMAAKMIVDTSEVAYDESPALPYRVGTPVHSREVTLRTVGPFPAEILDGPLRRQEPVRVMLASDYDALVAECERLRSERDTFVKAERLIERARQLKAPLVTL